MNIQIFRLIYRDLLINDNIRKILGNVKGKIWNYIPKEERFYLIKDRIYILV